MSAFANLCHAAVETLSVTPSRSVVSLTKITPLRYTGQVMRFTGITVLKVENGLITEETGLDDGVTALRQLGFIPQAWR